ncbi:MAG: hypothetical protein IJH91_03055 [Mogibacterium sp.]|nr:hypothetical protein [Mogibacterium sp.]
MNIWAHRGCSYRFPENTLQAFREACQYDITGVEFDVHFTKDKELVVIHDEWVDRTTEGTGEVRVYTLTGLQSLRIKSQTGLFPATPEVRIPTLREVLTLLRPFCRERGLRINIELKTGKFLYPGIEPAAVRMVRDFGLMDNVVFSSFHPKSVVLVRRAAPEAEVGFLADKMKTCVLLTRLTGASAIHPGLADYQQALNPGTVPVRVWSEPPTEYLYPDQTPFDALDIAALERQGVTDLFTNVPERYCARV